MFEQQRFAQPLYLQPLLSQKKVSVLIDSQRKWPSQPWVRLAALVPTGALLFSLAACSSGSKRPAFAMGPVAVRAVAATTSSVPLDITAIGNVEALSSVDVKARVAGMITKMNFQEGQDVRAGQTLFELDQEPFLEAI